MGISANDHFAPRARSSRSAQAISAERANRYHQEQKIVGDRSLAWDGGATRTPDPNILALQQADAARVSDLTGRQQN